MEQLPAFAAPKRDLRIDLTKTVAIVCVVLVHSVFYSDPVGSAQWVQAVFLGSLARPAVPLFLMCSGALLLRPEKELPLKRLLLHNLLRLLAAMVVWGMGYKLWYLIPGGVTPGGLWQALKEVLLFRQEFHFYYIHIMILVYLFLPVTRVFVRGATRRQLQYALAFWFAFGILYPTVLPWWPFRLLYGFPLQWQLNMTYAAVGYGLLGWYLRQYPLSRRMALLLWGCGFVIVFGGTLIGSLRRGMLYEAFFEGMSVGVCLMAAGVYCLAGTAAERVRRGGALVFVSKGSFCVYLVHVFFLFAAQDLGYRGLALPRLLLDPLAAAALLLCSLAIYWLLSKVPVVNRWLI